MTETKTASRVNLRPLAMLAPYLFAHKRELFLAALFLLLASAATLAIPIAVRRVIDHGFETEQAGLIESYFSMLIVVVAVLAVASSARYYFVTWLGERIVADLRRDVFKRLTQLSPGFYDKEKTGELISRLTADTTQIKSAVGASTSIALRNFVLFVGASAMMVATSPSLSLIVLGAIPLIVLPLVLFGRKVRRRTRIAQDRIADASAYATEQIGGIRTLLAFRNGGAATKRFTAAAEDAFEAARLSTRSRAILTAFAIFLIFASIVVVLWLGAADVLSGRLSAGTLGQFVLFAVLAASSLGELSQVWTELSQAAGAAERIAELLEEEPAVQAPAVPVVLPPARGEIAFENVTFAYPTRPQTPVVKDMSFRIRPGERVAIVGPSGAGKSSLFALALRFYDPHLGRITIDGVDIRQADPQAVRERIAFVPQDVVVFSDTIAENIRYGRPGASDSDVTQAAEVAAADEFIAKLPDGMNSQIGERGVTLSGGQRQRLAIARAVLVDAPILLLDEATSALDAESEALVQAALERIMRGRTTLVIAHRLATVLGADRLLVVDDGRIVEEGTHAELVAKRGLYARLAELQFGSGALDMLKEAAE
jgi:ATP-binding cassette, subfamily B, bacterial